ncbi:RelA/SpoT domain-containing protein, partial [Chromobacterium vaccinii]
DFVVRYITEEISKKGLDAEVFFKCPPKCRTKEVDSICSKIVKYNLTYPFSEIKDLVGVRFIVLLSDDVELIQRVIEECEIWNSEITRDYLESRSDFPEVFEYESLHVCVSPKEKQEIDGDEITTAITCEIQVRTILQHAYAELTHDNIYKPLGKRVSKTARRFVARSQALMESTDHFFCETMKELEKENKP